MFIWKIVKIQSLVFSLLEKCYRTISPGKVIAVQILTRYRFGVAVRCITRYRVIPTKIADAK